MLRKFLVLVTLILWPLSAVMASGDQVIGTLLNQERAAQGLQAVGQHPVLVDVAAGHARDMAQGNFMSHTGSDGSSLADRLRRAGFCYRAANENVAMGYRDPAHAMAGWFASPGHRRNALSGDVTHFVFAQSARSYVLVMARPC